eukprot:12923031-Prorocentrum_lima.AAC.1
MMAPPVSPSTATGLKGDEFDLAVEGLPTHEVYQHMQADEEPEAAGAEQQPAHGKRSKHHSQSNNSRRSR